MEIMPQGRFKLHRILLTLALTLLAACNDKVAQNPKDWAYLQAPQDRILVRVAISDEDQQRGFSGIRNEDWPDNDGIIFLFDEDGQRGFWMPDTYFDLDLFFLDKDLRIIDIDRKVPHFIGRHPQDRVPRARIVWARHVLELKASSPVAARLRVGDQLRWDSPTTPPQIK